MSRPTNLVLETVSASESTVYTLDGVDFEAIRYDYPPGKNHCWGDMGLEQSRMLEKKLVAIHFPGRTVRTGAVDEDGEYLLMDPV